MKSKETFQRDKKDSESSTKAKLIKRTNNIRESIIKAIRFFFIQVEQEVEKGRKVTRAAPHEGIEKRERKERKELYSFLLFIHKSIHLMRCRVIQKPPGIEF